MAAHARVGTRARKVRRSALSAEQHMPRGYQGLTQTACICCTELLTRQNVYTCVYRYISTQQQPEAEKPLGPGVLSVAVAYCSCLTCCPANSMWWNVTHAIKALPSPMSHRVSAAHAVMQGCNQLNSSDAPQGSACKPRTVFQRHLHA